MGSWDELSVEARTILLHAVEEGWLSQVIGDFLGHAEGGGAVWMFGKGPGAIEALVPRFAAIVKEMVVRGLIELVPSERYADWPDHVPMTDSEIDAVLADQRTWIAGDDTGPIMLMTTDHADRLLGR